MKMKSRNEKSKKSRKKNVFSDAKKIKLKIVLADFELPGDKKKSAFLLYFLYVPKNRNRLIELIYAQRQAPRVTFYVIVAWVRI